MRKSTVVASLAALLIVFGLVVAIESSTPNSTAGVTIVDANVARLPRGETFVLTHQVGKTRYVWEITYVDNAVEFHCDSWLCSDLDTATLCGVDCKVEIDGGLMTGNFFVWLRPDGAVNVEWPWGWTYRPYKS